MTAQEQDDGADQHRDPGRLMPPRPSEEAMAHTDPNTETELKLAFRPDDLGRLRSAPVLTAGAKGRAVTRTLESVYFDTPDLRLMKRLVTLRVRKQGTAHVQTLKAAPGPAGGLTRSEWEWPVSGPEPDLGAITEPEALELLAGIGAADLKPAFTSHVKRTVRHLNGGDTAIEVAFDSGEIRLPGGVSLPLNEVELELKAGSPSALFDLAGKLVKVAPLRVETRTKAARGYALAAGTLEAPVKAGKLALDPDATVESVLCVIVRSCLAQATANEACVLKGEDEEGVHQMRVALRRLRSALALFKPFLPPGQYDELVGEVKWLAAILGEARDWDVFLGELLAPVSTAIGTVGGMPEEDLAALRTAAESRRERAYAAAREALESPRYTGLLLHFGGWLEAKGWRDQRVNEWSVRLFHPVSSMADALLEKRHKKARKAGRGFAALPPEDRHQLRKTLKKLRYAAEFFRALYDDKPVKRYTDQLSDFQDALGHLNDVATAMRLLQGLHEDGGKAAPGERRAAGIVIGWHARGVVEAEDRMVRLWKDFSDAKPFWSRRAEVE